MRRSVIYFFYLVLFIVLLLLPSAVRYLRYYDLQGAESQEPPVYEPASVPARVPTPAAGEYSDEPEVGQGWVLLDEAHDNRFELAEISYLDSRLSARGYELLSYEEGDLATALRPASAFVVIAPMSAFSEDEVLAISDFVNRGGRLLMVGDPTRFELIFDEEEDFDPFSYSIDTDEISLNSLANAFDLVFNGDYLYNTVDSEGNFQNIILDQAAFAENALTREVEKLAFYGSHSIQIGSASEPLLSADENTWSSATDRSGGLNLAALGGDGRVLALGDIDFLSEPYYTVFDNSRFISQMADFLVGAEREFVLTDFPFFLGDELEMVYVGDPELGPDAFDEVVELQRALRRTDRRLSLVDEPGGGVDVLYAGLYNQASEVSDLLDAAGVTLTIDPPVETEPEAEDVPAEAEPQGESETDTGDEAAEETPAEEDTSAEAEVPSQGDGAPVEEELPEERDKIRRIESDLGDVQMAGTALILLAGEGERREMVVLAASAEGLENTLGRLIALGPLAAEPALDDCMLQEALALCPTGVADETVEETLITSGSPEETPPASSEEPEEEEELSGGPGELELNADVQGPIALGESVEGTLDEDQSHGWLFSQGPAVVNIVLQPGEDMDGTLELFDADGQLMAAADSAFEGEEERLELISIPDDQEYTIVVRDFFQDGGSYVLSVVAVTTEELGAVDQGELPIGESVEATLGEDEAHAWTFTIEAPAEMSLTLSNGPELDGLMILFGPDGSVLEIVDQTLTGEEESLTAYALEQLGEYTIVVRDYTNSGGDYTLLLELSG